MQQTDSEKKEQSYHRLGGILIAAAGSGGGKTTVTCGLLRLLVQRGYNPCAFKCGPDYIDPSFHQRVLGVPSYNLDPFFMGKEGLRHLYEIHSKGRDISVIEGVMGYYDGLGFTGEASTYSVAAALRIPVILVVDCKGMSHSVMAVVEGFVKHRQPSMIQGVLFNRMPLSLYEKAAEAVRSMGLIPCGCLPESGGLRLESRHLGLMMAQEVRDFSAKIDDLAGKLAETVDVDGILGLAESVGAENAGAESVGEDSLGADRLFHMRAGENRPHDGESEQSAPPLRVAVARDEAFCFLYEDNLNFLREKGAEPVFFSPLHDEGVPVSCDALYLSGGYPELYAGQLADNSSMKQDIRQKIAAGMPCIAECGGFLYLHEQLEAQEGSAPPRFYEMAGVIPARAVNRRRKGRFGYIEATLRGDCLLGKKGDSFRAHEFHYWESEADCADLYVRKPGNGSDWMEGVCTETLYAGFPHLYFYGSPGTGEAFLAAAAAYRVRRGKGEGLLCERDGRTDSNP